VLTSLRFSDRHSRPGPARRRFIRVTGLAAAAGLLAGGLTALVSVPAASASVSAHAVNPHTVNVKHASLAYLRAQAKFHYAGYSLPKHQATSVNASAVPLLVPKGVSPSAASVLYGLDVSAYQGDVDWTAVKDDGASFAYIKATEGSYYTNPYFAQQYVGSYDVGLVRGAYAFAIPNYSSGKVQAEYLAENGGAWSADGQTLPAALDIEYNPYSGNECYNLSQASMKSWIKAFLAEYHKKTSRWAVIYSTTNWWDTCVGNYTSPWKNSPYWVACYCATAGSMPDGVPTWTFWQFADSGEFPGDQDVFNGPQSRLVALAKNT
jgi:GH25 family lysozyme M1 (1,4-beta-N-acetylmuramidase)